MEDNKKEVEIETVSIDNAKENKPAEQPVQDEKDKTISDLTEKSQN